MKTTDTTVLDEPKIHEPTDQAVIVPAIENRPRRATGVKEAKIYIDGKFYSEANAKVSVLDHGLLYGDGIFEGIRFYNGRVFRLEEHLHRLWDSARSICLEIPMPMRDMTEAVLETIRQNHLRYGYIRLLVTRGPGTLGLNPNRCKNPCVIVIADKIQLYPKEYYERGLDIITVATTRNLHNAVNPAIKSLNYLNNILAKIEANNGGCEEAIMLNNEGYVAECTGDNIFIARRGQLQTPTTHDGILEGITRNTVIELAKAARIHVEEIALTRHDVFTADECFLTGTGAEIIPVTKCDGRLIGAMATLRLPLRFQHLDQAACEKLQQRLYDEFKVEAPLILWDGHAYVRVSCQIYNTPRDYERLAEAIEKISL